MTFKLFFGFNVLINNFFSHVGTEPLPPWYYQYFWGVKWLAQGHNTAEVNFQPPTCRSGVRRSTTDPPIKLMNVIGNYLLNILTNYQWPHYAVSDSDLHSSTMTKEQDDRLARVYKTITSNFHEQTKESTDLLS